VKFLDKELSLLWFLLRSGWLKEVEIRIPKNASIKNLFMTLA